MKRALIVLGLLFWMAGPAFATTLLWMDVAELTQSSTSVVMGTVSAEETVADAPGVGLNRFSFQIDRTLKGDLSGTVVVLNPLFAGAPAIAEGDEMVLFLYTRDGKTVLTGFQQGSFKIVTDALGRKVLERGVPSRDKAIAGLRSVDSLVSEILAAAE